MEVACQTVVKRTHRFFEKDKLNVLIVADAYSKWLEIIPMSSTTSLKTTEALRSLFARYGIPEELFSDNGPQLTTEEFTKFMRQNVIKCTHVPLYTLHQMGRRNVPHRRLK